MPLFYPRREPKPAAAQAASLLLVRAGHAESAFVLADELTGNLDPETADGVLRP